VSIVIREGDIQADGEVIAKTLRAHLTPLADRARYDWLYKRNPHGAVRVWLAIDEKGEVIGSAAAFPRALDMSQRKTFGWVFGDFCVSDKHRSLGPAVALQRALLQAADAGGVPVSYDFPSTAMTAVYKRLKMQPAAQMIRMAKLLRVNRKVGEHVRNETLANAISSVGNIFLSAISSRPKFRRGIKVSLLESSCGPEFDLLDERSTGRYGLCVQRSSDYLNWRYLENPYKKHQLMTAKRDESLLGFVVFSQNGQGGEIVDVFGEDDELVIGRLISEVVELFRRSGVITVSAELIGSHPWTEVFKKLGFYPRESKPFIVYAPAETRSPLTNNGALVDQSWFITGGDRDS
jgi:GNAT superfamily N-acetyltransferase